MSNDGPSGVPVAILAGGLGTRMAEETEFRPKPMVTVGDEPILWHIMKSYAARGFDEFVIALGYKSEVIKDYFLGYRHRANSFSIDLGSGAVDVHGGHNEDWKVHLVDTGLHTMTGGRTRRVAEFLDRIGRRTFMLTYGDGLADVDVSKLLAFHRQHGRLATITAVRPPARFGAINFADGQVESFEEKPQTGEGWINGGFFVFEPEVAEFITDDETVLEREPLERLAADGQLSAYQHDGFWQCMDTVRDIKLLNSLWASGESPWKVW